MKCKSTKQAAMQYSMLIEWSEEDQAYLVTLPEWAHQVMMPATHGDSYTKAAKHGKEVLKMLIDVAKEDGKQLPPPRIYHSED